MRIDALSGRSTGSQDNPNRATLDQAGFIKLLIAQLSQQNPLNSMDEKDMMQEITQMSTVQGMSEMRQALQRMQASNLIGKTIVATDIDNEPVTGRVTSLQISGDIVRVRVNGILVDVSKITSISE